MRNFSVPQFPGGQNGHNIIFFLRPNGNNFINYLVSVFAVWLLGGGLGNWLGPPSQARRLPSLLPYVIGLELSLRESPQLQTHSGQERNPGPNSGRG